MSLSDLLAVLSLLLNILGTFATILAAIFGYQSLKQFQAVCKFEEWIPMHIQPADSRAQLRIRWNLHLVIPQGVPPPLPPYN
jgi:hypothetical protein